MSNFVDGGKADTKEEMEEDEATSTPSITVAFVAESSAEGERVVAKTSKPEERECLTRARPMPLFPPIMRAREGI